MMIFGNKTKKRNKETLQNVAFWLSDNDTISVQGYTSLDHSPEVMTACKKISELIGSMTIHLMANTERGDIRINNELSRAIDVNPEKNMTRIAWMESIVMNLLLYGRGNSIVLPHTKNGYLDGLEPISASRVSFRPIGYRDYKVLIDGKEIEPENVIHFVYNPDKNYLWKGRGITTPLKAVTDNLQQAAVTEKAFLKSKWKPSVIVKVDALTDDFASPEGRRKLLDSYVKSSEVGEPWLIPAEAFDVKEVRPLSLSDLAIKDTIELDKRTVASIIGVPPFLLGIGEYKKEEWNAFINNTIKPIALMIQQEMTKKIIISEKMYLKFNILSLLDWDIETIYKVFGGLSDKGIVTGNEVRDRLGMSPKDGLDELRILENYIPSDMIGKQKKLIGGDDE